MIIYLAGFNTISKIYPKATEDLWLLSSFWEHGKSIPDYVYQDKHILDSGAFSSFSGKHDALDWDLYVKRYCDFIKETKQKLFFEMDIDKVVGLPKVEYYRKYIEDAVGIAPIPVWHSNRGADYFIKTCEQYKFVAIGTTTVMREGKRIRKNPEVLKWFIDTAHERGAKIHGLGFTSVPWLFKLKFDSVDSTTWNVGGKYGNICKIDVGRQSATQKKPKDKTVKDVNRVHLHNFGVWVEFQRFAEENL